jgi:hypothetical protein
MLCFEASTAEAYEVFQEDVNAFVEDQLRFACRLALAEEQLLSVANCFKNSACAGRHSGDAWSDDLDLVGCTEDARGVIQAVSTELSTSLAQIWCHRKEHTSRIGHATAREARQGGEALRTHLAAFHQESAIERNARADLRAEWFQFQGEMRRELNARMQNIEECADQRLDGFRQSQECLAEKVENLEEQLSQANIAVPIECGSGDSSKVSRQLQESIREQAMDEMNQMIRERIEQAQILHQREFETSVFQLEASCLQLEASFTQAIEQQRAHWEGRIHELECSDRGLKNKMQEVCEVLEQQVQRESSLSLSSDDRPEVCGKDLKLEGLNPSSTRSPLTRQHSSSQLPYGQSIRCAPLIPSRSAKAKSRAIPESHSPGYAAAPKREMTLLCRGKGNESDHLVMNSYSDALIPQGHSPSVQLRTLTAVSKVGVAEGGAFAATHSPPE